MTTLEHYDPRVRAIADPRIAAALAVGGRPPPFPVSGKTPYEEQLSFSIVFENFVKDAMKAGVQGLESLDEKVKSSTVVVKGVDGNDVELYISTPADFVAGSSQPLPCVYHMHGGGMAYLRADFALHERLRQEIAALGVICIAVEFRNSAGVNGPNPFPAGLNDCMAGLGWVHENRSSLGISKLVLMGESGGANLALATCIKAKREDKIHLIDGVYAFCPFIFGRYDDEDEESMREKETELRSLSTNADIFLSARALGYYSTLYNPDGENLKNPLAWPYWAQTEDIRGLPPHVISLNELDPLHDEGLVYYRKLLQAGVSVRCITTNGTTHAANVVFIQAAPDLFFSAMADLLHFANSLK